MQTIRINRDQPQAALQQWEQDGRDGKLLDPKEAAALPVEEHARQSAEYLWPILQAKELA